MLEEWQIAGYEVWKDIKGTDYQYQVSTWGHIRSIRKNKIQLLKLIISNSGFLITQIEINGKQIAKNVHRLVAETFIPNSNNLREIRHVDDNKLNNNVDNLMWQSTKNRVAWKTCNVNGLIKYNLEGKKIRVYELGVNQAVREMKIPESKRIYTAHAIRGCCTGNTKSAFGYKWKYIKRSKKRIYDCM
jgi:hypothetical protein